MKVLQKVLQNIKVLQTLLHYFQSIAKIIVKSQKYCNKYCKILKVLQYLLQTLKVLQ